MSRTAINAPAAEEGAVRTPLPQTPTVRSDGAPPDLVHDYLVLGLRIGRLSGGYVDTWTGGRVLPRQVESEPRPAAADLARDADRLLAELAGGGFELSRHRFLAAQVRALKCAAARLAGEPAPFLGEMEACFDVDVRLGDPARYAAAHDCLRQLLPGSGSLRVRLEQHRRRDRLPPENLGRALRSVTGALRQRSADLLPLPRDENVRYELVTDRPRPASYRYLGGFRSEVAVDTGGGHRAATLPFVVSHGAYPGHHCGHCIREVDLVLAGAFQEHHIALAGTPQALLAEGAAEVALSVAVGTKWGGWAEGVLREAGVHLDGQLAERMHFASAPLRTVRQDAAILLQDRGWDPDDVAAYVRQWLLLDETTARHTVRLLQDPFRRAHTTARAEGARLVRSWLDARPVAVSPAGWFRRLLSEPLVPQTLKDERDGC